MNEPKIFLGPMSVNVVDVIKEISSKYDVPIGVIPSRRQVEFTGGYVNYWTTEDLANYTRTGKKLVLERDHGGFGQGAANETNDTALMSFEADCKHFDIIHIDPWKMYQEYELGLQKTVEYIKYCHQLNPELYFEVGTEEAIRPTTETELDAFMCDLRNNLTKTEFSRIKYLVIQSGTSLCGSMNTGTFDHNRLKRMLLVCKKWKVLSKEHNGDFLDINSVKHRFKLGLDGLNIAPELGQIETKVILNRIKRERVDLLEDLYTLCYESRKWEKWVAKDFIPEENKETLIVITGHYIFSTMEFKSIKLQLNNVDYEIRQELSKFVESLVLLKY